MNIFVTDPNPAIAARHQDLKRVVKMILESFQLMSNAMWAHGQTGFYKLSHANHPCSTWTAQSRANFMWLLEHALELSAIYTEVYGRSHKCLRHLASCEAYAVSATFPSEDPTPFANCTEYKYVADVHKAYRFQMLRKWNNDKKNPRWPAGFNYTALIDQWSKERETSPV